MLDKPSDDALHLLRVIANGYAEAPGRWPFWQWVTHQLWNEGLDAEEVLRGLRCPEVSWLQAGGLRFCLA